MKKAVTYLVFALLATTSLQAQENKKWTLKECIDYALEKNIQLQQDKISLQESEVDVKSAKAALFPNLSFSTSQSIVNRPYSENSNMISGSEVISSNKKTTYNGNYSLSSRLTIWNGNKNLNNIKQQKINSKIAGLTVAQTENSLKEQITQLFIQILYANESVTINKSTVELSKAQYERGKQLYGAGSISQADLAQLSAQVSSDEYQVISAQSSLDNYKLQLKQLLEIDNSEEMVLSLPQLDDVGVITPLPDKQEIYNIALSGRPEIESGKLSVENSDLSVSIAKAGYYPTLSLSASSATNNVSTNDKSFGSQIKYGLNNQIGLTLSIPIFNNRETKSSVEKAKMQKDYYELELLNKQKGLYKEIESMWLDAKNAQQQFEAAKSKLESTQISFNMVNEQFNLGMKNIVELLTVKNNLLSASQEKIQAKYMAILNRSLLEFYAGQDPVNSIDK